MAQLQDNVILDRLLADELNLKDAITALMDRTTARFIPPEGLHLDYKLQLKIDSQPSMAEIARDVLAFSNTEGGVVIVGVSDDRSVVGHEAIDGRKLRDALGPYMGTRVVRRTKLDCSRAMGTNALSAQRAESFRHFLLLSSPSVAYHPRQIFESG